ncbi:MAG: hypothetical protein IPJ26_07580 [Bacteroidetes bacterium]|nr:hypothetical protein [Bacteroidota bacterium]
MEKLFIYLVLAVFCSCNAIAQKSDKLVLQSLEYLNQKFHLNLEKENVVILIKMDSSEKYICYKYFKNSDLPELARIKWQYEIEVLGKDSYEFTLKSSSEYKGTFEVLEKEQDYTFTNLRYVKRND